MSIAVRYYTESHNTEKLCKAAADAIGVEALTVDTPLDGPVDKLILGSSCPALWESSMKYVKEFCTPLGLTVNDNDFHCKGEFLRFHKGKPDAKDIAACADWAKKTF